MRVCATTARTQITSARMRTEGTNVLGVVIIIFGLMNGRRSFVTDLGKVPTTYLRYLSGSVPTPDRPLPAVRSPQWMVVDLQ